MGTMKSTLPGGKQSRKIYPVLQRFLRQVIGFNKIRISDGNDGIKKIKFVYAMSRQ